MIIVKADDGTEFQVTGYRLRMVFLEWFIMYYYNDSYTGYASGPQTYAEAVAEAEQLTQLIDKDKEDVV